MKIECETCNGKGCIPDISECCGDTRETDMGLCYQCHDHCGPAECIDCDGTGFIETNET